tara:strand:- start:2753 stop:4081 length:1329 start_codon:yes stop_codon:yes gene_type:complete
MNFFENKKQNNEITVLKSEDVKQPIEESYMSFGSQFRELGAQNLALPLIYDSYTGGGIYVRFGADNLFPQLVNQMKYTSPINGAIINFTVNAAIGGGFTIKPRTDTHVDRAKALVFEKRYNIKKMLNPIAQDYKAHESVYILLDFSSNKDRPTAKRVPREKVRNTRQKDWYFICDDWAAGAQIIPILPYRGKRRADKMLLCFEAESLGIDSYSVPSYTSALNWAELDGKMSLLHKNNILNSIFPSFVLMFPKKPSGEKEKETIRNSIEGLKGASNAGKVAAFFANKLEQMPKLEAIPTNQNDKLFEQTDQRIDAQICKAHCIDPLLMGIRVSGSLGSGNELKQSYTIFEKNTIMPLRVVLEDIFNTLLGICGIPATFEINEFQIINETIVEIDEATSEVNDALNAMSPLVANKVLEEMTGDEIRSLATLKPLPKGAKTRGVK